MFPAPIRFNPASSEFRADPYPTYRRLRHEAPHLRSLGMLVLTRYDDVDAALRERRLLVAGIPRMIADAAARLHVSGIEDVLAFVAKSVVFTDNPEHLRLRRLIGQAYSPQALRELRRVVDVEAQALLSECAGRESVDVVSELAAPLPVNVLCSWIGVPAGERRRIAQRVHVLRALLDPGLIRREQLAATIEALAELVGYFRELMVASGSGRLISLLSSAASGEDRLSPTEVAYACIMSFVAGNETTESLIANTLAALHQFPEQYALLRADRGLISRAVEESIRYDAPLQMTKRLAADDLEINGHPVKAGEHLLLCLGAANRDELRYVEPDVFDLNRPAHAHLGFGYGMHACLGGMLARLQAERCLAAFLNCYASSELSDETPAWQGQSSLLRRRSSLRLRVRPRIAPAEFQAAGAASLEIG